MISVQHEDTINELLDQIRSTHLSLAVYSAAVKKLEAENDELRQRVTDLMDAAIAPTPSVDVWGPDDENWEDGYTDHAAVE